MRILVVGGAGFIGSHMAKQLRLAGAEVCVLDNLSTGHREFVRGVRFVEGDLTDKSCLQKLFADSRFEAVMHFAASSLVAESMQQPEQYYQNNVSNTLNLLEAMRQADVSKLVYSSTAAVYGLPRYLPIDEKHTTEPVSPYGRSKLMVEQILADYDQGYGLKSICLRYFNACGADPDGELGECHVPETHLIPLALQAAAGIRPHLTLYGDDYDTFDGTGIRDYVHVHDLCEAHSLSLQALLSGHGSQVYNLGNAEGFSVKQVLATVEAVTGRPVPIQFAPRRQGDPACLIADSQLAREHLGWQPRYPSLTTMVEHAWAWEQNRTRSTR